MCGEPVCPDLLVFVFDVFLRFYDVMCFVKMLTKNLLNRIMIASFLKARSGPEIQEGRARPSRADGQMVGWAGGPQRGARYKKTEIVPICSCTNLPKKTSPY